MKTKLHHILSSGLFASIILFLFLGSSNAVFSQTQTYDTSGTFNWTDTFMERNGKWQLIASAVISTDDKK